MLELLVKKFHVYKVIFYVGIELYLVDKDRYVCYRLVVAGVSCSDKRRLRRDVEQLVPIRETHLTYVYEVDGSVLS